MLRVIREIVNKLITDPVLNLKYDGENRDNPVFSK